ncbi:MAG: aminotransferase class III-fold pyridoxal phosphate-dependent enzyme, partial [Alphaproteobacteria bacterium]|nr:aminotransferase class III-fold pyridoxal phosphate-dependent enzyme [Alphaproteobacteria bacterium]
MASGSQNNNHGQEPDNEDLDDLEATGQVIAAGEKIVESVGRIDEVLETASSDASAYGDALAEFGEKILAEGGEEAQALIAQMLRHTQEMQEQNNLLRDQLAQSSGEIDQLRGDLEEVKREATIDALTTVGNRKYFGPLLNGVDHLRHTHVPKKNAFSRGEPEWGAELADDLERLVQLHDASTIAAVIVEPVQRSYPATPAFFDGLRELCARHGIVLVFDEVVTGFRHALG